MDTLQILFVVIIVVAIGFGAYILVAEPAKGNSTIAATLCGLFAGYTGVQIAREGIVMFFTNHTVNLTGIQVWWDLVMAVVIAFFFIAPRARAAGMNLVPWAIFAGLTASIGLLAMCARLFWLEARTQSGTAQPATSA